MLGSKNLKAMLRIALEGPYEGIDGIISDNVPLWKNDNKYCLLHANPSSYLNYLDTSNVSDVSCCLGHLILTGLVHKFCDFSILTNLYNILGPFVDLILSKGYILGLKMVGVFVRFNNC